MWIANRVGTAGRRKNKQTDTQKQNKTFRKIEIFRTNIQGKKSSRGPAKEGEGESIQLCHDQWHSNGQY